MTERFDYRNFIPYVQLHEYEALLLAKPDALAKYYPHKVAEIEALKSEIGSIEPEEINDTPAGAPSKRIINAIPKYEKQKTSAGVITAQDIGLSFLRDRCPHFNDWVTKMETI